MLISQLNTPEFKKKTKKTQKTNKKTNKQKKNNKKKKTSLYVLILAYPKQIRIMENWPDM